MKIVVMITLLLSDADVLFTFASFEPYSQEGFVLGPILISIFTLVYLLGTHLGNRQNRKFCKKLSQNIECGMYHFQDGSVITIDHVRGYTEDEFRKFMVSNGLGEKFYQERSNFIRNIVKWKHSVPFFRMARFGWMADIPAGDFAGILNANALYSFTMGFIQFGCTLYYMFGTASSGEPQVNMIILTSLTISTLSLVLSLVNLAVAFPKVLNELEKKAILEEQRQKALDQMCVPHILGLRQTCERTIAPLRGQADKTDEILQIMHHYEDEIQKFIEGTRKLEEKKNKLSQSPVIGGPSSV
jgi:hypothetical protein